VKYVIACLGNSLMGDDGVGIVVAGELVRRGHEVIACGSDLSPVMTRAEQVDLLIIVDAVDWSAEPGSILVAKLDDVEERYVRASHSLRVSEVVELMRRAFGRPLEVYIVGVQPERVEPSTRLSPSVERAVSGVVAKVEELLVKLQGNKFNA